jgi:hypothetical protein
MNDFSLIVELIQRKIFKISVEMIARIQKEADHNADAIAVALREVRNWNASRINEYEELIKQRMPYVERILKVLMKKVAVAMDSSPSACDTVNVQLFIHKFFVHWAGYVGLRPGIMENGANMGEVNERLRAGVNQSIQDAVLDIFPVIDALMNSPQDEPSEPAPATSHMGNILQFEEESDDESVESERSDRKVFVGGPNADDHPPAPAQHSNGFGIIQDNSESDDDYEPDHRQQPRHHEPDRHHGRDRHPLAYDARN